MISGPSPKSFYTKNKEADTIENKNTLFNALKNQLPMLNIFHTFGEFQKFLINL